MSKTELEMDWNTAHKYMSLFLKNPFFLLSFFFFFFFLQYWYCSLLEKILVSNLNKNHIYYDQSQNYISIGKV